MKKRSRAVLTVGSAALLLAAIFGSAAQDGRTAAPGPGARDAVRITHVSPTPDTVLRAGDKVTLVVRVDYALVSARSATLAMFVQSGSSGPGEVITKLTRVVKPGERSTGFRTRVRAPQGDSLHVYVALQPVGTVSTSTVDHLVYRIAGE